LCNHSVVSQHFMEPEGSLPRSQELSTCTYPEPDQSGPQHSILSLTILMLYNPLHLRLPIGLYQSGFPTRRRSSSPPFPLHAPPPIHILLDFIILIRRVQIMKLLVMQFSPPSRHSIPLWCDMTCI
jgi:hypothetical protein